MSSAKPFALITGASKGIGRSLSTNLASKGFPVLLVARDEKLLHDLAAQLKADYKIESFYFPIDLSKPGSAKKVKDWVVQNNYTTGIMINNAGYAVWGRFTNISIDDHLQMMQLNVNTIVEMCHEFIPLLLKQEKSYLMNVSSTTAYQAVATLSTYAASKMFVIGFTRSLRTEFLKSSLSVSVLSPGTTTSDFMNRAAMDPLKEISEKFTMDPDEVAKIAINGMFAGKAEIIPGFLNKFSAVMTRLVPKKLTENIAANIYLKNLPE
ncbi:MAG: SDR family NAD(P)-dependent oxidoreductase [Bacteroidia bacterium]